MTWTGNRDGETGDRRDVHQYQIVNNRDANRTQNFMYDSLNRIQQAYSSGPNWGETYSSTATAPGVAPPTSGIDAWGNMTNHTGVTGKTATEGTFNCPANTNNQLTTCGLTYDAAGNTYINNGVTYTYDAENRLVTPGAGNGTYLYDGDGQRMAKLFATSGTVYWRDLSGNPILEDSNSGVDLREYIYFNGKKIARRDVRTNTVHYMFSDNLGSTSLVTDALGTMAACNGYVTGQFESDYFPYGGEMSICNNLGDQNYKFTGKERDSESTLDYFGARHYTSAMGRFMTPDQAADDTFPAPLPFADFRNPQTLNLYSYALNNPVSNVDPDGHDVHVCVDAGDHQNCFNMTDQQYADLYKQQNGQQGINMPGGSMPGGNITCGGQVCGSATYFEPGMKDTSLDLALFVGGVASLGRGLIEGGLGLLRGAGEAGAGTAAREAGVALAEKTVVSGGKAAIRDALENGAVNELQKQAVKRALARGAAGDTYTLTKLADGSVKITTEVAGRAGGRAVYEKVIDAAGQTSSVVQRAYDASGSLVHVDPKFP